MGNIIVRIQAKYRKDRMKTEEVYLIWKRFPERQTDRWTTDGSASDKLRWPAAKLKYLISLLTPLNAKEMVPGNDESMAFEAII